MREFHRCKTGSRATVLIFLLMLAIAAPLAADSLYRSNLETRREGSAIKRAAAVRGVYINRESLASGGVFEITTKLKDAGGNAIVFDAKDDSGLFTYLSPVATTYLGASPRYTVIPDLRTFVATLKSQGVYTIARVVTFKDGEMAKLHPEWCLKDEWLDPANPAVQKYILAVVRELVACGVDEIQMDYFRYPANGENTTSRKGLTRPDVITGMLSRIHGVTSAHGVPLSLDMFGIIIWEMPVDVKVVGQELSRLVNHCEVISPMIYPSHFSKGFNGIKNPADEPYRLIFDSLSRMHDKQGDRVLIRPWLQAFPLHVTRGFGPRYMSEQIKASRDAGGSGWLLWSPGNRYEPSYPAIAAQGYRSGRFQARAKR